MKPKHERVLPLNPDLEKAVLYACMNGKLNLKTVQKDELSKLGRSIYMAMASLNTVQMVKPKTVWVAATELYHADPDDCKSYLKEISKADLPEIQAIMQTLGRKRIINSLVNEATAQIGSGDYSVLSLKALLDKHSHVRADLKPLFEEMSDTEGPPVGVPIPCLPRLTQITGGLYGVWVIGGEPGAGKSTLALQLSMSVARRRPVLYYDFEQGSGVIRWHISKALDGDKKKIKEATSQLYVRHSMGSLESDLESLRQPCLIVVDSIQKVASSVTYRRESLESWVHRLESMKKYGHHIIMVSEKKRGTYGSPALDGYKETGELEYAADTAFDLLLPNEEDGAVVEVHITKNRHYKKKGLLGEYKRVNSWWFTESKNRRID